MSLQHSPIENIANKVGLYEPEVISPKDFRQASVALILRQQADVPEILFIQRATSDRDRWSGQIAFPGGGKETHDVSLAQVAIRETQEEVGLILAEKLTLGRLDDVKGRSNHQELPLVISCFIFQLTEQQSLAPNYEVAEAFWVQMTQITDPQNHFDYKTDYQVDPFPAINLGQGIQGQERILWGLTYRFVQQFVGLIKP